MESANSDPAISPYLQFKYFVIAGMHGRHEELVQRKDLLDDTIRRQFEALPFNAKIQLNQNLQKKRYSMSEYLHSVVKERADGILRRLMAIPAYVKGQAKLEQIDEATETLYDNQQKKKIRRKPKVDVKMQAEEEEESENYSVRPALTRSRIKSEAEQKPVTRSKPKSVVKEKSKVKTQPKSPSSSHSPQPEQKPSLKLRDRLKRRK